MISHARVQALISARLDGPLAAADARDVELHLATCGGCRRFADRTRALGRELRVLPHLPASPNVSRGVMEAVNAGRSPWSRFFVAPRFLSGPALATAGGLVLVAVLAVTILLALNPWGLGREEAPTEFGGTLARQPVSEGSAAPPSAPVATAARATATPGTALAEADGPAAAVATGGPGAATAAESLPPSPTAVTRVPTPTPTPRVNVRVTATPTVPGGAASQGAAAPAAPATTATLVPISTPTRTPVPPPSPPSVASSALETPDAIVVVVSPTPMEPIRPEAPSDAAPTEGIASSPSRPPSVTPAVIPESAPVVIQPRVEPTPSPPIVQSAGDSVAGAAEPDQSPPPSVVEGTNGNPSGDGPAATPVAPITAVAEAPQPTATETMTGTVVPQSAERRIRRIERVVADEVTMTPPAAIAAATEAAVGGARAASGVSGETVKAAIQPTGTVPTEMEPGDRPRDREATRKAEPVSEAPRRAGREAAPTPTAERLPRREREAGVEPTAEPGRREEQGTEAPAATDLSRRDEQATAEAEPVTVLRVPAPGGKSLKPQ